MVKITWSDINMPEINKERVLFCMSVMKERKYLGSKDGKCYTLYKTIDEPSYCAFTNVHNWILKYRDILGKTDLGTDPLFPSADEKS